ncbi:MAG: UDP-N-acetylmuramate--L-alanine ligase [Candidatus Pacebacteria bacterium]|nr:UDP-N-acetylmuramate--L-alanine ligase [Candidatus Paceibacterota bacterium]
MALLGLEFIQKLNTKMDIENIKKVHCIGIGGIGVSAVARFFHTKGANVSGSDVGLSEQLHELKKKGICVYGSHDPQNVPKDADIVVYSPAVPDDNVEMQAAKEYGILNLSYPEILGRITEHFTSIAVSGTNGKTTTTALLGKMLESGGKDPTVIIGGRVAGWDNNLRVGESDLFVVEGCEYKRSMLNLQPYMILLTNIEEDHLDYYKDIDDILDAFTDYVSKLTEDNVLVYNNDDEYVRDISKNTVARTIPFGMEDGAGIRAKNVVVEDGKQSFTLEVYGEERGILTTHIPGTFNIYNILAALTAALDMGVSFEEIKKSLDSFKGMWRRFEKVGEYENAIVISDYAHHPTAIRGTIKAAREFFPDKKILAVFQPHHEDRTIKLFDDFVESFADADETIIAEIYHVQGREEKESKISSKDLVKAVEDRGGVDMVSYAKDLETTEKMIRKKAKDYNVILIMGAGDIDSVARQLVSKK